MPRIFDDAHLHDQPDAKTRRKLQDQRRMAYRRAIEHYAEQCQLQRELADFPELVSAGYSQQAERASRRAA
ncbi:MULTISPECIES: PA3496 family putative envelope integrity protein [Pseudomonas]|uniref:Transcriptional regulator n=1 Tax=Pseudomonas sediminis TaxID=1691904 RepID=A0A2G5FCV8_9PSED|nr:MULTISPECIES: transcriptional regulator [Pseudomonas]MDU9409118.1 transcriptional regulator [Pseudomonas sp. zfem001]PIA65811.1 transcriptional regulator [Pseudomonas sediminis]